MKRRALLLLTAMAVAMTLGAGAAMAVVSAGDATTTATTQDNPTQQSGSTSSGIHTEAALQRLVFSWGRNDFGQLGNGSSGPGTDSNMPVGVGGGLSAPDIKALAAGINHSLVLKNDGTVWAWGDNTYGQLGNGTTGGSSSTPVQVKDGNGGYLQDVTAIAAGGFHNLALKDDGTVVVWGLNSLGQLGNGTTGGGGSCQCSSNTPVAVSNLSGAKAIAGGTDFSLALKTDGTVRSWGANDSGQLGNGTTGGDSCNCSNTPVKVSNLSGVTGIAVGGYHSLAK
jgi:hypothetical protein